MKVLHYYFKINIGNVKLRNSKVLMTFIKYLLFVQFQQYFP